MPRTIKHPHALVCSHGIGKHGPYTFCTGTSASKRKDHRTGLAKQGKTKKVKTPTPVKSRSASRSRSRSRSRTPEDAMPYSPPRAKTPSPPRRTLRNLPRVDYKNMRKDPLTGKIVYGRK